MSKKSKKRRPKTRKLLVPAKFFSNTQVRVKPGTKDPNFPDIPIGGWSGTIIEVEEGRAGPTYLIEWDRRTLHSMHPVFVKRSERDGLELECMWLDEDDIEPDTGESVPIDQPNQIVTRPLRMNDQDDRIRAILGLTSDDPLPNVTEETLNKYHRHLAEKLTFPFEASHEEETGTFQVAMHRITVTALLAVDEADEDEGLLCEVTDDKEEVPLSEIAVRSGPNRRLVEDYGYWFNNWPPGSWVAPRFPAPNVSSVPASLLSLFFRTVVYGGFSGATLGVALASLEGAVVAAQVGSVLLGLIVGLLGARYGRIFGAVNQFVQGHLLGGVLGAICGAGLGALLGVVVIAWAGTLVGCLVGGLLGSALGGKLRTAIGGAMLGVIIQAWLHNTDEAWNGTWIGVLIGIIAGPILLFGTGIALTCLEKTRR